MPSIFHNPFKIVRTKYLNRFCKKIKMKYKFLSHTADVKFQAFGKDLEEGFKNSAYALANTITKDKIKPKETKKIKVKGRDTKSLLYDFLEEFLYLKDVGNFIAGVPDQLYNVVAEISGIATTDFTNRQLENSQDQKRDKPF